MSAGSDRDLLPVVPAGHGAPCAPLPMLIEYAVQRVYHELTVLADLLPKKLDMDRKVSIIHFAHTTRMLFVRLLAVVKWLKASTKIDYCTSIGYFLDQHAAYFVDTADKLVLVAREELMHARLPMFHIPAAVDVLTLGSYPRLPLCIKERFVSNEPLSRKEKQCVLQRLNQCIQYRLALDAANLPHKLSTIRVHNGTVELEVDGEFCATLTMLGTEGDTPWTLLDLAILVDAPELGDGAPLVHALQLNYLHQIVQARMNTATRPLIELYNILHTFCVSLQLDVLYCRACNAIQDRLTQANCAVLQYVPGNVLVLGYWPRNKSGKTQRAGLMKYSLIVKADRIEVKSSTPGTLPQSDLELCIHHEPVSHSAGAALPSSLAASGSLDGLLTATMLVRCRHKLKDLQPLLRRVLGGARIVFGGSSMPSLCCALLSHASTCRRNELLIVSVHVLSGRIMLRLPAIHGEPCLDRLRDVIENKDETGISREVGNVRRAILLARYERAAAHLPVRMIAKGDKMLSGKSNATDGQSDEHSLLLRFLRDPDYVLKVSVFSDRARPAYTLQYKSVSVLPPAAAAHAQQNICLVESKIDLRKLLDRKPKIKRSGEKSDNMSSKRNSTLLRYDLCAVVAALDRRIGAHQAATALGQSGFKYELLHSDDLYTVAFRVLKLEKICAEDASIVSVFWRRCVRRAVLHVNWLKADQCTAVFELVADSVVQASDPVRSATRLEKVEFTCGTTEQLREGLNEVVASVTAMARLYQPVYRLALALDTADVERSGGERLLGELIRVQAYTHVCIVLAYGDHFAYSVSVRWRAADRAFHLSFGTIAGCAPDNSRPRANPHLLVSHLIQAAFKRADESGPDLVQLAYTLAHSWRALDAMQLLIDINALVPPRMPPGAAPSIPVAELRPTLKFHIAPITETHWRLIYCGRVCVELMCLRENRVALRDGQSTNTTALVGLAQLCRRYAPEGVDVDYEPPVDHLAAAHGAKGRASSPHGSVPAPSPGHMSLATPVPTPVPPSPAQLYSVGTPGNPDSVDPGPRSVGVAEKALLDRSFGPTQSGGGAGVSACPVVVPVSVLSTLCRKHPNANKCPLEAYLSAIVSVDAIGRHLLSCSSNTLDPLRECIADVQHGCGLVRARVPAVDDRSAVDVDIRVDPRAETGPCVQATFHFVLKGTSQGVEPLAAADMEILSRFVSQRVAPIESAVAYVSVITLLRQHGRPGLVRAFAQVMRRELECTSGGSANIAYSQLCAVQPRVALDSQLQPGIWTETKGNKLLFWLRPFRSNQPLGSALGIVYEFPSRTCSLYRPYMPHDIQIRLAQIDKVIESCNKESQRPGADSADGDGGEEEDESSSSITSFDPLLADDKDTRQGDNPVRDVQVELERFRLQWRHELESGQNRTSAATTRVYQATEQHSADEFTRARQIFMHAVDCERAGDMHSAVRHYTAAFHLVPDIERRVYATDTVAARPAVAGQRHVQRRSPTPGDTDSVHQANLCSTFVSDLQSAEYRGRLCVPAKLSSTGTTTNISSLPCEVLCYLLRWIAGTHLDFRSVEMMAATCKGFYVLSRSDELWRLLCERQWGARWVHRPDSAGYESWRHIFIARPRIRFDGVYIAKTTYVRYGEAGFQDQFYRPWHLVVYYRYVRFHADGRCLMLSTADEPAMVVPYMSDACDTMRRFGSASMRGRWSSFGDDVIQACLQRDRDPEGKGGPTAVPLSSSTSSAVAPRVVTLLNPTMRPRKTKFTRRPPKEPPSPKFYLIPVMPENIHTQEMRVCAARRRAANTQLCWLSYESVTGPSDTRVWDCPQMRV